MKHHGWMKRIGNLIEYIVRKVEGEGHRIDTSETLRIAIALLPYYGYSAQHWKFEYLHVNGYVRIIRITFRKFKR